MMRVVMLAGVLAVSARAANGQDAAGNPEAGRVLGACGVADAVKRPTSMTVRVNFPSRRRSD